MPNQLVVRREKGKIWSPIRQKWLEETPEETVRQEYLCVLSNEYGFSLDQMDEELEVTGRGLTSPSFCTTASERVYITTSSGKDANGGSQGAVGDRRAAICGANAAGAGGL